MAEAEAATAHEPESGPAPEGTAVDGATTTSGEAGKASDPIERIRNDPDFAEKQYKNIQAAYNRAQQTAKAAEPMLEMAKQLGQGDVNAGINAIQQHLQTYGTLRNNPQLARMMDRYLQTGKLGSQDEIEDPEEDVDPTQAEIQALRKQLDELKRGQAKTSKQKDIERVVEELPPDFRDRGLQAIESQLNQWDQQARNGSQAASQALENIDYDGLKTIILRDLASGKSLRESELIKLAEQIRSENLDQKKRSDTGEPGVRSTGRESPPQYKSALEALRDAKQKQARGEL